jgi:hypothetical protein
MDTKPGRDPGDPSQHITSNITSPAYPPIEHSEGDQTLEVDIQQSPMGICMSPFHSTSDKQEPDVYEPYRDLYDDSSFEHNFQYSSALHNSHNSHSHSEIDEGSFEFPQMSPMKISNSYGEFRG